MVQADHGTGGGGRVRIRRWWAGIHGGRADKRRSRHALLLGVFRTFPLDFLDVKIVDGCDGWECGATNTVSLRYARSSRAEEEEDEKLTGPRDDRPLPSRVRGCHCEGRRCDGELKSAQASKHIPRSLQVRTLSSLPPVACRDVGPAV